MRMTAPSRRTGSDELDVCGALVLAAVGVVERDRERAGIGGAEREHERGILTHALGRVEGRHGLAVIGRDDPVDVEILLVDDPPFAVALDAFHRVDDQAPHADEVARLDRRGRADADLADVGHQPPHPPTVTFTSRLTATSVPSLCSTMARTSVVSPSRMVAPIAA